MTAIETIGMFYTILAVGCFTAAWLITLITACVVGIKTLWRWIKAGQQKDEAERDYVAHKMQEAWRGNAANSNN